MGHNINKLYVYKKPKLGLVGGHRFYEVWVVLGAMAAVVLSIVCRYQHDLNTGLL